MAGTQPKEKCPQTAAPLPAEIPSVIGMSAAAATLLLETAGFVVIEETEYQPSYASGTVIRQSPEAGTEATTGETVTIVVSTSDPPLETVPDVVGMGQARARTQLEEAGFEVAVVEARAHDPGFAYGRVIAQTPAAGARRPLGSTVTISVNPKPLPSPSPT